MTLHQEVLHIQWNEDALNYMLLVTDPHVYHVFCTNKSSRTSVHSLPAVLVRNMACKGKPVRLLFVTFMITLSKKNKKLHQGIVKLKKKMVDATGLSKCTVDVILAEKCSLRDGKFEFPRKGYKKSRIRVDPDDFDVSAIQRTVHQFYDQRTYASFILF